MQRSDRNEGRAERAEPKPETVFIYDIHGGVYEVICDRTEARPTPRRPEPVGDPSPSVIRRWLAGLALGLVALGLLAEPGGAAEPVASPHVDLQSW